MKTTTWFLGVHSMGRNAHREMAQRPRIARTYGTYVCEIRSLSTGTYPTTGTTTGSSTNRSTYSTVLYAVHVQYLRVPVKNRFVHFQPVCPLSLRIIPNNCFSPPPAHPIFTILGPLDSSYKILLDHAYISQR